MEGPGTGLRPTMLKLGAAPITPSLFWLPVMVYAPGPGIVSHSYGLLPLSGGMLGQRAEDGVRSAQVVCCRGAFRGVNDGTYIALTARR